MTVALARLLPSLVVLLVSCRDRAPTFPETPLGHVGHDWLAAHNRAEGHAIVHFTTLNRGRSAMSGAQMDSVVRAGVELAQRVGPLVPVRLLHSSDTALIMLLRSADGSLWNGRFKPAVQPSLVKVDVQVNRADIDPRAKLIAQPNPKPR
jgi:hypothetical protein